MLEPLWGGVAKYITGFAKINTLTSCSVRRLEGAEDGLKMAPRGFKIATRWSQDSSKIA